MTASSYTSAARHVIRAEAAALRELEQAIDENFDDAVAQLIAAKGRVIVTGIGKSGHIGRKIAATFASTGTPAQFVHPSEANHGDLGMITADDTVIAISNSGEAPELANLLVFTRRFSIPLIGLTSRSDSSLAKHADIVLLMPKVAEACGTGVVPTCSTTMTLALGDALAVALMKHRSFTAEHFREFHPGGKLGAQLARVRDLMHVGAALPLIDLDFSMSEALAEMTDKSLGAVGIINSQGDLQGIITDGDLRRHMDGLLSRSLVDVMTSSPLVVGPDDLAQQAAGIMHERKITCLFVMDPDAPKRPVGLLHIHDCLRAGLG
ncbi:MAG: SIS domain-containing protein [Paracoccaceae bacterium]